MSTANFDPVQFKKNLLQQWETVAPSWQKWWDLWAGATQKTSDRLIELAEITEGQRVLDIATGLGEPAFSAARQVGQTGEVIATDFSEQMLAKAQERAAEIGISNVVFHQIDAEMFELPTGQFDAGLCRWGITELPDPVGALKTIRGELSPGSRLAAAVWGTPPQVPFIGIPVGTLRQMFEMPPPVPGTPSPFGLADPDKLEGVLEQAGFKEIKSEKQTIVFEFPSFNIYQTFLEDIAPVVRMVLDKHSSDQQQSAWQTIAEAVDQYRHPDGSLAIPNEVLCVVGQT